MVVVLVAVVAATVVLAPAAPTAPAAAPATADAAHHLGIIYTSRPLPNPDAGDLHALVRAFAHSQTHARPPARAHTHTHARAESAHARARAHTQTHAIARILAKNTHTCEWKRTQQAHAHTPTRRMLVFVALASVLMVAWSVLRTRSSRPT